MQIIIFLLCRYVTGSEIGIADGSFQLFRIDSLTIMHFDSCTLIFKILQIFYIHKQQYYMKGNI